MRYVALSEITEDLPRYLRLAEEEEVVITRDGKPAGVLIGFRSEGDWLDFQLEEDHFPYPLKGIYLRILGDIGTSSRHYPPPQPALTPG